MPANNRNVLIAMKDKISKWLVVSDGIWLIMMQRICTPSSRSFIIDLCRMTFAREKSIWKKTRKFCKQNQNKQIVSLVCFGCWRKAIGGSPKDLRLLSQWFSLECFWTVQFSAEFCDYVGDHVEGLHCFESNTKSNPPQVYQGSVGRTLIAVRRSTDQRHSDEK